MTQSELNEVLAQCKQVKVVISQGDQNVHREEKLKLIERVDAITWEIKSKANNDASKISSEQFSNFKSRLEMIVYDFDILVGNRKKPELGGIIGAIAKLFK